MKTNVKTDAIRKSARLIDRNRIIKERSAKLAEAVNVTQKNTKIDSVTESASKSTPMGRRLRNQVIEKGSFAKDIQDDIVAKPKPRGRVLRRQIICGVNSAQNGYVTEVISNPKKRILRSRQQSFHESSMQMVQKSGEIKLPTKVRILRSRSQTVGPQ